ncbi:MAG: DUF4167 domain-containing protein [Pseudomonadota bacterium]
MRPAQKSSRARGRGRAKNGGGGGGNNVNRVYESAGPEGKVRGTPQQIVDKYLSLARDAQTSGDRVMAENFLQHAEHYQRILLTALGTQESRREDVGDEDEGREERAAANGHSNGQLNGHAPVQDAEDVTAEEGEAESGESNGQMAGPGGAKRGRRGRGARGPGDAGPAETAPGEQPQPDVVAVEDAAVGESAPVQESDRREEPEIAGFGTIEPEGSADLIVETSEESPRPPRRRRRKAEPAAESAEEASGGQADAGEEASGEA